jgi:hypothetical protein
MVAKAADAALNEAVELECRVGMAVGVHVRS